MVSMKGHLSCWPVEALSKKWLNLDAKLISEIPLRDCVAENKSVHECQESPVCIQLRGEEKRGTLLSKMVKLSSESLGLICSEYVSITLWSCVINARAVRS